jgi:hypothetical protein
MGAAASGPVRDSIARPRRADTGNAIAGEGDGDEEAAGGPGTSAASSKCDGADACEPRRVSPSSSCSRLA